MQRQQNLGGQAGAEDALSVGHPHLDREDLVPLLYDELIHYGYRPEGLKPHLAEQVKKRSPKRIGLNGHSIGFLGAAKVM